MSASNRKAGQPVFSKPKLRLVPSPDEDKRPEPDPEMKEILDDMRGRYRVRREQLTLDPNGKDAA